MSIGSPAAADVPHLYDVVIDGQGYIFLRPIDTSLPFRTQRALYSRTQTFVERQNVSNAYGDNAQSFYLTVRQRNWSLGEQQRFYDPANDGAYWRGSNVDVSIPGQVRLTLDKIAFTFPETVEGAAKERDNASFVAASATNLYRVSDLGVTSSLGAHGAGDRPSFRTFANDETKVFFSFDFGGTGVRSWDGSNFNTFSVTTADTLCYLNNTLYGYHTGTGSLILYDTTGAVTTLFTWKAADGSTSIINRCHMAAWGGKLLIGFHRSRPNAADLWIYDGTGVSRLEVFPENFNLADLNVLYGVVYIAGSFMRITGGAAYMKPAIMFYDGSLGKLWEADDWNTQPLVDPAEPDAGPHPAMSVLDGKLVFTDETTGRLMSYNPSLGGVSGISTFTPNVGGRVAMSSAFTRLVQTRKHTSGFVYPGETVAASGYVTSSLIDFQSSLTKRISSIRVRYDPASDGDGGSVDLAYRLENLDGSYTTLATGVASETDVPLPANTVGHAISVRVTLNRGTSTLGPTLRSMSVLGSPILTSYRECEYILDLSGVDGATPVILNDNETPHPRDGLAQGQTLAAVIASTSTFQISDIFSTYKAVMEPDQCEIIEVAPEEYIARLHVREV